MKIVSARRICQVFFGLLFLWLCLVSSSGQAWWQLRGWPVNWFLQLDPLAAVGVALANGTLRAGLLWSLVIIVGTIILGRFFCGWICPLGTIQQCVGFLGNRKKSVTERSKLNQYRKWQSVKYYVLAFLLAAAAGNLLTNLIRSSRSNLSAAVVIIVISLLFIAVLSLGKIITNIRKALITVLAIAVAWVALSLLLSAEYARIASLQIGLLDPICLMYRATNLVFLPVIDSGMYKLRSLPLFYEWAWLIGTIFLAIIFLNLLFPRFYCRFICPLGALLGVLAPLAIWRIGKKESKCADCIVCEADCQGACNPAERIRISECVMCMNCLEQCRYDLVTYQRYRSASGEITSPDISRRGLLLSLVSGIAMVPILRLPGKLAKNWHPTVIRPPGSLPEEEFLARCIKCGQCMRVCPTNVIQPAGFDGGLEALWTPVLNNRIGSSGCQFNCVACGNLCPTGAIRPISLDEKLGRGKFSEAGPIRLGTAFVDRGRCLPWAMDKPCIVCQENCPLSPKAIFIREIFQTVRDGTYTITGADQFQIEFSGPPLSAGQLDTGDYYCRIAEDVSQRQRRIVAQTQNVITVDSAEPWQPAAMPGSKFYIQIRLQRPYIDLNKCTGCGICEHECPVTSRPAIRVTADNESRSARHSLLL